MSMNIFLKNTKINFLPNYYVDKCLILQFPMIAILNEQYTDPTRLKTQQQLKLPVFSENMSIDVRGAYLKGLLRGMNAFEIKSITVSIDRCMNVGSFERVYGREESKL